MSDRCRDRPRRTDAGFLVVDCSVPRRIGAAAVVDLAERICALLRQQPGCLLASGAPAVELDGRDPARLRAVVTLPLGLSRPNSACTMPPVGRGT